MTKQQERKKKSRAPSFPQKPTTERHLLSPSAVLTEKLHLACIVKIFINGNLCHSDRPLLEKTSRPCTNLSLKLSEKFVLMAIWIGCVLAEIRRERSKRETGSVFRDFSIKEVMLLVSGNLTHKQMFYLEYLSVVYLPLAPSLSPLLSFDLFASISHSPGAFSMF